MGVPAIHQFDWTDERLALLRKRAAEKKSAKEIATELGNVTRSAVIGKANREGIALVAQRASYTPHPKPREAKPRHYVRAVDTAGLRADVRALLRSYESRKPVSLPKLNLPEPVG